MPNDLRPGIFLLADPTLTDPHFEESVVLLCAHSDEGAMGLVVNRPMELRLAQVLNDLGPLDGRDIPLNWGGPVAMDQLHVLYGGSSELPDSMAVSKGVWLGGNLADYGQLVESGAPLRFFLGYSGWDAGQLESEIETGTWRMVEARVESVFDPDPKALWAQIVSQQDPGLTWLKHLPSNPSTN